MLKKRRKPAKAGKAPARAAAARTDSTLQSAIGQVVRSNEHAGACLCRQFAYFGDRFGRAFGSDRKAAVRPSHGSRQNEKVRRQSVLASKRPFPVQEIGPTKGVFTQPFDRAVDRIGGAAARGQIGLSEKRL